MSSDASNLPPDEFADVRTELVRASFGLETVPSGWDTLPEIQRERFLAVLAARIEQMISESFEQLMAILYRLDVDEEKVRVAFGENTRPAIARALAELVVERQLRTIRTRRQRSR
ncbi:MAG: hypothetical protein ACPL7D_08160 [Candidatus Sumerlaeaceae bacterium]